MPTAIGPLEGPEFPPLEGPVVVVPPGEGGGVVVVFILMVIVDPFGPNIPPPPKPGKPPPPTGVTPPPLLVPEPVVVVLPELEPAPGDVPLPGVVLVLPLPPFEPEGHPPIETPPPGDGVGAGLGEGRVVTPPLTAAPRRIRVDSRRACAVPASFSMIQAA